MSNTLPAVSPKRGDIHLEEVHCYVLNQQGISAVDIAKASGLSRNTIQTRIKKVREAMKFMPQVDKARDEMARMVPAALGVYWQRMGMLDGKIATNVLVSQGVVDLAPGDADNPLYHKETSEILMDALKLILESGDKRLIDAISAASGKSAGSKK